MTAADTYLGCSSVLEADIINSILRLQIRSAYNHRPKDDTLDGFIPQCSFSLTLAWAELPHNLSALSRK